MEIEHRIDERARRIIMRVGEAPTGTDVSRYIIGLVNDRPELASWDWINDIRQSSGAVDNADIAMVAEAFAVAPPGPCWTFYISHDRNLDLWCKEMDAMFHGRQHRTALTPESAEMLLDSLRASSPAPSSS